MWAGGNYRPRAGADYGHCWSRYSSGQADCWQFCDCEHLFVAAVSTVKFSGWVYREIRQSLVDLERMFTLLDEYPDVRDPDNAPHLHLVSG